MKFGKNVKFTINNELLTEYQIASDVQELSDLFDRIQGKSNRTCVMDILDEIKQSLDPKGV
ncbi:MAG: hypothetical protein AB1295_01175 [Candidatus Micrarchaeota archaeon]